MRLVLTGVLLFGFAVSTVACSAPRSARCKKVCKREANCSESEGMKYKVDENECIVACTSLDRDDEQRIKLVTKHIACVAKADNCEQVASCRTQ